MVIRRRLTEAQKVVSRKDPAIHQFGVEKIRDYYQTLDIEKLGSFSELSEDVSVFEILPLQTKYESYVGVDTNHWLIFSSHVKSITGLDFELEFENGNMKPKHRKDFQPEVVMDIADIIISLANRSSDAVFFSPPVGYKEFIFNCQSRHASQAEADVVSEGAKIKGLSTVTSPKKTA